MTDKPHVHMWRLHTQVDGCHFWKTIYACECGATEVTGAERDFHDLDDPYAVTFLVDGCARCQELMKGAKPQALVVE